MKKIIFTIISILTSLASFATDVWEGSHHVSWDTTLKLEASKFTDLQVGQKIVFDYTDATDGIELKYENGLLPGTHFCYWINGAGSAEIFVTPKMLEVVKASGIEVCGANFNLTKVWFGDGKDNVTANTVWTGYFWMDDWKTLEISKNCFVDVDWTNVKALRFYSEANRTDYVINILTSWDEGGKLGDQTTMTMTNDYAELSLEGIDMAAKLADVDRLMIQCNKEGGNAFNFTSVELVMDEAAGITTHHSSLISSHFSYNLSGQRVSDYHRGIVIMNGKKVIK